MHERLPAFIGHNFNVDWNPGARLGRDARAIPVAVLNRRGSMRWYLQ